MGEALQWVHAARLLLDTQRDPPSIRERAFKLPWREAGPPNHHDDKVVSDQEVVDKELSLSLEFGVPLSRKLGTYKTVRTSTWSWL